MNNNIRNLQDQIQIEERKIQNCDHDFNEPIFNPETIKVGYGSKMIKQGSDIWCEYEGYRDKQIDRWTRTCKKCGYEQHTHKQEPIISGHKPSFS